MGLETNNCTERPKDFDYKKASIKRITAILIGVIFIVTIIVYFTPMPEEYFESCDRPCHELDWPMICRVKLTLEVYKSLSRSCRECPANSSDCNRDYCISADGHSRGILAANRQLPGPSIQVCENDIMVIDVVNRVPGQGLTLHWRGQPQVETPFMDGVPMVTQCPIPSYTTFQYKFRASAPGTHLYHAHSGAESSDGLFGAFVVRRADTFEPQRKLYDFDKNEHVMVISEWSHGFAIQSMLEAVPLSVESILVNGKGRRKDDRVVPLSTFNVSKGKKFRFRVAHAGGVKGCPVTLEIERHSMQLIAMDGHSVVPKMVNSLILGRGERADFVLNADQEIGEYRIKVYSVGSCAAPVYSAAVLKYDAEMILEKQQKVIVDDDAEIVERSVSMAEGELNAVGGIKCGVEKTLCVSEVQSLEKMPEVLSYENMQTTIYLPFKDSKKQEHHPGSAEMDGVTFTFPPSPLLTQPLYGDAGTLCGRDKCQFSMKCECVHVKSVPLGNTVEIILVDQGGESEHVFHLHGYSFYVIATKQFSEPILSEFIEKMHLEGTLFDKKNLIDPVQKDTVTVPKFGAVALRFKADNPGFWILRDERSSQWTRGLDVLLQVGERSDFVQAPSDFPKCGSFVGPHYFLI